MSNDQIKAPNQPNLSELPSQPVAERQPKKRRFFRFFLWSVLFLLAVILLAALGVGYWARQFYAPIDVAAADTTQLLGWMTLRDLSKETPETQRALAEKYFAPIRDDVQIDMDSPVARKLLPYTKKYVQKREEMLADWEAARPPKKLLRRDYQVDPPTDGRAIRSSDVAPTDELIARMEELKASGKPVVPEAATGVERNIRLMIKNWFLYQISRYDDAPDDQKASVLESVAEELLRLQNLYNDYREQIGMERLSDIEQLRDFDFLTSSWYVDTTPEELARLLWFKDLAVSILIAKKSGLPIQLDRMIFRTAPKRDGTLLRSIFGRRADSDEEATESETGAEPAAASTDASTDDSTDGFFTP